MQHATKNGLLTHEVRLHLCDKRRFQNTRSVSASGHGVCLGLGKTGILVVTRLFGMLLAALSVQFVLDGLRAYGISG